jgi:beta-lactamase class D
MAMDEEMVKNSVCWYLKVQKHCSWQFLPSDSFRVPNSYFKTG